MKGKNIYDAALAILGEPIDSGYDSDYSERAPYIIATFCCDSAEIDKDYRETHGLDAQPEFSVSYISLDDDFPLCKRFSKAAAFYLAAMLVIEEDESLSDSIFEKYCDAISVAVSEIPFTKGKTRNVYPD